MSKAKRQAKRATRVAKRDTRKTVKQENKQERKLNRQNTGIRAAVSKAITAKSARKDVQAQNADKLQEMQVLNEMKQQDPNEARSIVAEVEEAEERGQQSLEIPQVRKVQNYLQRRKRTPEQDPEMLAAQLYEERQRQIEDLNARQRAEIQKSYVYAPTLGATDDMPDDEEYIIEEEEFPDFDDTHEDILEEEESQFSFDQDEDNFLDPDTLGVALGVGKSVADKYRQNRFAKGQKAFGKTKAQWEKEQAKQTAIAKGEIPDDSLLNTAKKAAEDETKKSYLRSNTNNLWLAGIGFVALLATVYYIAKENK